MQKFICELPKEALPILEWYLSRMVDGIRKHPGFRSMTEVWEEKANMRYALVETHLSAAAAHVMNGAMTDQQALEWLRKQAPGIAPYVVEMKLKAILKAARARARSDRNAAIARMTNEGYSNKAIAAATGCSLATAAKHAAKFKGKEFQP